MKRVWAALDILVALLVASSINVWFLHWNAGAATNSDAMFFPALYQDMSAQGLGVLKSWHYASSPYLFPDATIWTLLWLIKPEFETVITGYAAALSALSVWGTWLLLKPRKDASFAIFSAVFTLAGAVYIALACAASSSGVISGTFYTYGLVSIHHYGTTVNVLLGFSIFLWWRQAPSWRRLGVVALWNLVGVASDLLFIPTFFGATVLADWWFEGGSPFAWLRRRWSLLAAHLVPAVVSMTTEAALNPLSPLRVSHPRTSVVSSIKIFLDARVSNEWRLTETIVRVLFIAVLVVVAVRVRREAKKNGEARTARLALVLGLLLAAVLCNVGSTVLTGKYTEPVLDRYLCPAAFFPVFGVLGLLGAWAADRVSRREAITAGIGVAGIANIFAARFESHAGFVAVHPAYVDCLEQLGLERTAGFATYWNVKPLIVIGDRRFQAIQVNGLGGMYTHAVNDQWAHQNWFGAGSTPDVRFALMAGNVQHSEMVAGTRPFEDDGLVLEPAAMRERYGEPDAVHHCKGTTIWTYRPGSLAGRLPLPFYTFPLHVPASHPQIQHAKDAVEVDGTHLVTKGTDGIAVFGPFIDMPPGDYRVRWTGHRSSDAGRVAFDVAEAGHVIAGSQHELKLQDIPEAQTELVTIDFHLADLTRAVEFRVSTLDHAIVTLDEVIVERR